MPSSATAGTTAAPTRSSASTGSPASLPSAIPTPSSAPTSPAASQTLIGTAYQGAEPGCIGLRVGATSYELTGNPVTTLPHDGYGQTLGRVRVTGHLAPPTLASHCMMGRIFDVDTLTKL